MAILIQKRVRDLKWFGDPPKFVEVDPVTKEPTGNVLKGMAARKLMMEINRLRRVDQTGREIRGSLPPNWEIDWNWENGSQVARDRRGNPIIGNNGESIQLPKGKRGPKFGRRIPIFTQTERAVLRADTLDLKFIEWWAKTYPDIPHRILSRDYFWYKDNRDFVTEVDVDDVDIILLGCVGEFMDVTKNDDLPELQSPVILA